MHLYISMLIFKHHDIPLYLYLYNSLTFLQNKVDQDMKKRMKKNLYVILRESAVTCLQALLLMQKYKV